MNVVDVEKVKEGLGQIQSTMTDFDSVEWEIYRKSKGTWDKDFHRSNRNFTMEQLMKEKEHLMKEKELLIKEKELQMKEKEHLMKEKELQMEKENLYVKLSLKKKGQ
jgi:hypothetical protein